MRQARAERKARSASGGGIVEQASSMSSSPGIERSSTGSWSKARDRLREARAEREARKKNIR